MLAAGAWSGQAQWLPDGVPPIRPVKGEILTLRGSADQPVCTGIVAGERVYMVPRSDGRLIVGATVEERGFETTVTAGGVHELLREAYRVVPEIAELELLEAAAGLRPGSPDNAPLLGRVAESRGSGDVAGLIIATGFFRHGILLTPAAAEICRQLLDGVADPRWAPFRPDRFAPTRDITPEHSKETV